MAILLGLELGPLAIAAGLIEPPSQELLYAFAATDFNEDIGPAERWRIARARAEARKARKGVRRERYRRAYARKRTLEYWRYFQLHR